MGVMGGLGGVFCASLGGGWFNSQKFTFATSEPESFPTIVDYQRDAADRIIFDPVTQLPKPIYGPDQRVSGFRLRDSRASYGIGLETFALGFPIHFDWAWRTLFNKEWEDVIFASEGGSSEFRKPRFSVWIGYDF